MKKYHHHVNTLAGVLCGLLLFAACHEDKGNYTYVAVDEITIDTTGTGILPGYSLYRYDTLRIAPVVYLNGQRAGAGDPLDYHWSIYKATTGGTAYPLDTLGAGAALDTIIPQPAGLWVVLFTVTQRETGIKAFMKTTLQIDEALSDGWMVLYEKEGDTDVGLIVNDRVKKNVTRERLFLDIYSASNGQRLSGKPVSILHSIAPLSSAEVLLASERDLVAVDKNTFGIYSPVEKLFWSAPRVRAFSYLGGNSTRREVVLNDNRIHYVNYMSSGVYRMNAFGVACSGDYGQLAPWMSSYYSASFEAVVYDQTYQRFLCVQANGVVVEAFDSADKTAFDVNDVQMEMLFSDFGRLNYEYSLMRDGSAHALLVSNFSGLTTRISEKIAIAKYDMSHCPGIAGVTSIAPGGLGEILYYASGPDVYLFKYNVTGSDQVTSAWTAPAGETVTCVRLQKFYYPQFSLAGILINNNAVIYIATWNEATQTGTVYQLTANPSNGTLDEASQARYTGFGKVKDMSWKWTM
jgi:hypothetical protein